MESSSITLCPGNKVRSCFMKPEYEKSIEDKLSTQYT